MTTSALDLAAPPEAVFDVLVDVGGYPEWLVGAKRIRATDDTWPEPGSSFHHSVGVGPLTVDDRTTVVACERPHVLELLARIGPFGRAKVRFCVSGDGDGGSHVSIEEEPVGGLVKVFWNPVTRPLVASSLWGRNALSLQAFRARVEESTRP